MMIVVVAGLHVLGLLAVVALVAPSHQQLGKAGAITVGLASPPTRWGCVTHLTLITSLRSTTPPVS